MNLITYLLARLLPTTAVDRAVRAITKAAAALAAAEDVQNNRAASIDKQIANLRDDRAAALAGADRAARVAKKLTDLTA
jgi:hypothetical protein